MPDPSVHSRIRSLTAAVQKGETEGLVNQVLALHAEIEASDRPVVDRLSRIQELGRLLVELDEPGMAAVWFRTVLDYWQDHAPVQGRVRVVVAAGDLALALARSGDDEEARTLADEAREGVRDLKRSAPEQVLRFASRLADVYAETGPLEMARDLLETALSHVPMDAVSDGDLLLVALADVERRAGRAAAADVRLTQAERIVNRARGAEHPHRAAVLASRARLCVDVGRPSEAIERLEGAVALRAKLRGGARSVEQADDLVLLAELLEQRGDAAAALPHHEARVALCMGRYGREAAETAAAANGHAFAAVEAGDLAAARSSFERARSSVRSDAVAQARADLHTAWVAYVSAPGDATREAFTNAVQSLAEPPTAPVGLVVAMTRAYLERGEAQTAFTIVTGALEAMDEPENASTALRDALLSAAVTLAESGSTSRPWPTSGSCGPPLRVRELASPVSEPSRAVTRRSGASVR